MIRDMLRGVQISLVDGDRYFGHRIRSSEICGLKSGRRVAVRQADIKTSVAGEGQKSSIYLNSP